MTGRLFGIDKLVEDLKDDVEAGTRAGWEEPMDRFGVTSPIEKLLLLALFPTVTFSPSTSSLRQSFGVCSPWPETLKDRHIHFMTQCTIIGTWPVDFVVAIRIGDAEIKIVIECDGHDFHERTKEQAARDRSRDRELQRLGFKIFRFTGSEIYRNAFGCAREVANEIQVWLDDRPKGGA